MLYPYRLIWDAQNLFSNLLSQEHVLADLVSNRPNINIGIFANCSILKKEFVTNTPTNSHFLFKVIESPSGQLVSSVNDIWTYKLCYRFVRCTLRVCKDTIISSRFWSCRWKLDMWGGSNLLSDSVWGLRSGCEWIVKRASYFKFVWSNLYDRWMLWYWYLHSEPIGLLTEWLICCIYF